LELQLSPAPIGVVASFVLNVKFHELIVPVSHALFSQTRRHLLQEL